MKKNPHLKWLFGIIVFLAVLCFWQFQKNTHENDLKSAMSPVEKTTNDEIIKLQTIISSNRTTSATLAKAQQQAMSQEDRLQAAADAQNAPISFFGKVVDQDDQPLSGVHIVMSIRQAGYSPTTGLLTLSPKKESQSDSLGNFEWTGEKGDVLSVDSMEKNGYESEPNVKRDYGTSSGRFESPVFFKMWKTNIHEQLITGEKPFHIIPDGRSYFINLTDDTIAESGDGDLKVWVKYPAQTSTDGTNNWLSEIDVINGGLLEETDAYSSMFSAPTDGYIPTFQHDGWIRDNQHGSIGTRRFYIMLKNGREYGRITIELIAPFNNEIPGLIRLSYAINPSGSRILR